MRERYESRFEENKNINFKRQNKFNEGKKRFYVQQNIGKAKYVVSMHDGVQTHKDGSPFYDIKTFKNKIDLSKYMNQLTDDGYIQNNRAIYESIKSNVNRKQRLKEGGGVGESPILNDELKKIGLSPV